MRGREAHRRHLERGASDPPLARLAGPVRFRLAPGVVILLALLSLPGRPFASTSSPAPSALPAGTVLYVRLTTPVSTASSKVHAPVKARVVREVLAGGAVVIPLGAVLEGKVTKVVKSADPATPALLDLQFTKLDLPGGKPVAITCRLLKVENARETVLADGSILGVKEDQTATPYVDNALGKLAQALPSLSTTIEGVQKKQVGSPNVSIAYPAGTDMQVAVDQPLSLTETFKPACAETLAGNTLDAVNSVLEKAPQRSETQAGRPGDPLNLVIIGSAQQVANTFREAGWVVPARRQTNSVWKTVQAMIQDQGYGAAPISNLYLFSRPQDLAFEKMLNTFNMRHHLRMWRSGVTAPGGSEIWLAAAVHDTGIDVHPGVVSHATSPNLDNERAKAGADLLDTGLVSAEALVTPPHPLSQGVTGTGGAWHTDGQLLVIELKSK